MTISLFLSICSSMASEASVKQYLAYWFQLGKPVLLHNGQESLLPRPVYQGDRYSPDFERCWKRVSDPKSGDCYLQGTTETIANLLSTDWEISDCSRCSMPIPQKSLGIASLDCPCNDLPDWPNTEMPQPRGAVSNQAVLSRIRDRLRSGDHTH